MFLRFRTLVSITLAVVLGVSIALGQTAPDRPVTATPTPTPAATPNPKAPAKPATAEQIVEAATFIYGFPGGRATLNQIRKTTSEKGKTTVIGTDGKSELINYQRWILRGESLDKEKIRIDQYSPTSKYSIIYNNEKIVGVDGTMVFALRDDAVRSFESALFRGLEGLLRYKENGSTLELAGKEKLMGVEYFLIDVTDTKSRKTRYYVSQKTYRVMMLTYEEGGVKFRRRFYNHNYAQGTLVPFRSVLTADDRVVEESDILTITFGQKVDPGLFNDGSS